jgi:hypothetical protein
MSPPPGRHAPSHTHTHTHIHTHTPEKVAGQLGVKHEVTGVGILLVPQLLEIPIYVQQVLWPAPILRGTRSIRMACVDAAKPKFPPKQGRYVIS